MSLRLWQSCQRLPAYGSVHDWYGPWLLHHLDQFSEDIDAELDWYCLHASISDPMQLGEFLMPPSDGGRPAGADTGVAAALARMPVAERHNAGPPETAALQLDLLRDLSPLASAPPPAAPEAELPERPSERRGRTPGSLNKRTEAWVAYILGRNASPLESLARVVTMGPLALAREMSLAPAEAFREWRACAEAVLPYLHQKLPAAVIMDANVTTSSSASHLHLLAVKALSAQRDDETARAGASGTAGTDRTLDQIVAAQRAVHSVEAG